MRFEKVSKEAFIKDCKKYLGGLIVIDNDIQKILDEKGYSEEKLTKYYEEIYENISIPTRSTSGSAGYDFKNPFTNLSFCTLPIFIPTGIRIFLDKDKILQIVPRSSSSKKGIMLANTIGIIDSDYVNADNEGDIIIDVGYGAGGLDILDIINNIGEEKNLKIFLNCFLPLL